MPTVGDPSYKTPRDVIEREAEAEAERAQLVAEGKGRLAPRCPECGAIGTLEEIEGALRCTECDETVLAGSRLGGFGRR